VITSLLNFMLRLILVGSYQLEVHFEDRRDCSASVASGCQWMSYQLEVHFEDHGRLGVSLCVLYAMAEH
jgi:hypothetical protein